MRTEIHYAPEYNRLWAEGKNMARMLKACRRHYKKIGVDGRNGKQYREIEAKMDRLEVEAYKALDREHDAYLRQVCA